MGLTLGLSSEMGIRVVGDGLVILLGYRLFCFCFMRFALGLSGIWTGYLDFGLRFIV